MRLGARLVLVETHHLVEVVELVLDRHPHGEVDEVVVHEGHAGLETVRHRDLVFDHEQPVQEGLSLEVEGLVDVVLGTLERPRILGIDVAEYIARRYARHVAPDRCHQRPQFVGLCEALPVLVVGVDILFEVLVVRRTVVPPRIPAEQLVAAAAREHDLHELAGEPGRVPVRIALADARLLEVVHELRERTLHVARLQDDLVLLGAERRRHRLGDRALVEGELHAGRGAQVEPAGEGLEVGERGRRDCGDRPTVHAAAQVAAQLDIAQQLTVDRLREQPVELFDVLLVTGLR